MSVARQSRGKNDKWASIFQIWKKIIYRRDRLDHLARSRAHRVEPVARRVLECERKALGCRGCTVLDCHECIVRWNPDSKIHRFCFPIVCCFWTTAARLRSARWRSELMERVRTRLEHRSRASWSPWLSAKFAAECRSSSAGQSRCCRSLSGSRGPCTEWTFPSTACRSSGRKVWIMQKKFRPFRNPINRLDVLLGLGGDRKDFNQVRRRKQAESAGIGDVVLRLECSITLEIAIAAVGDAIGPACLMIKLSVLIDLSSVVVGALI